MTNKMFQTWGLKLENRNLERPCTINTILGCVSVRTRPIMPTCQVPLLRNLTIRYVTGMIKELTGVSCPA